MYRAPTREREVCLSGRFICTSKTRCVIDYKHIYLHAEQNTMTHFLFKPETRAFHFLLLITTEESVLDSWRGAGRAVRLRRWRLSEKEKILRIDS